MKDLESAIEIRDQATAIDAYARAKGADEASQLALEVKLRAERKAGEFLQDMPKGGPASNRDSLSQLGIERHDSSRWQRIAAIPESDFEEYIESSVRRTQSGLLTLAKNFAMEEMADREVPPQEVPPGRYAVIVADPPWPYGTRYDSAGRRAASPYPEMTLEGIATLPIPLIAAEDCVLWLWTTHRFMRYAFPILDRWGFREVAILTWVKDRMGLGEWLRSQSEFCLMAVRGAPRINLTNETTILHGPLREHSRKPDEFYEMVGELCELGNGRRGLDWFSRQKREGWDQVGDELERF